MTDKVVFDNKGVYSVMRECSFKSKVKNIRFHYFYTQRCSCPTKQEILYTKIIILSFFPVPAPLWFYCSIFSGW